ncbi:TIGR02569 family protein [Nonomuraea dietziae]|uniref:TIGR02569 family protein n=1 Tax=Nonomuraea dietziae TaxID=65515 RepID=UPI0034314098
MSLTGEQDGGVNGELPPQSVLDAFGVAGTPVPLPGGEGRSVRVGGAVFKPVDDPEEAEWCASVMAGFQGDRVRVPRPLRSELGGFVVDGWAAAEFVEGKPGPGGRWPELFAASKGFHEALGGVERPGFLERRTHPWAVADRVAWGAATVVEPMPGLRGLLDRLIALRRPLHARSQVIHGDLAGNVLFADGVDPVVIDFSPYWRPPAYGEAVAVVDGLLWWEAGREVVELAGRGDDFAQLLVRALIFRSVTLDELCRWEGREPPPAEAERFAAVADLIAQL